MRVYRIARTAHIHDLGGMGAKLHGGRWNSRGTQVIYCSESRSLATVEYLVHVSLATSPAHLSMATIEIGGEAGLKEVLPTALPPNWKSFPPPPALSHIGTRWAQSNATLLLRVPSAVVPEEFNVLINPSHPDMHRVRIVHVEPYHLDQRLTRHVPGP